MDLPVRTPACVWGRLSVVAASFIVLSACAGLQPEKRETAAPSPAVSAKPAAAPTKEMQPASSRGQKVTVLTPGDFAEGAAKHEKALLDSAGTGMLTEKSVGYYMEVEEARLRQLTGKTGLRVVGGHNTIVLGPIGGAFASSSIHLSDSAQTLVAMVAPVFKEFDKTLILIKGYADSTGTATGNQRISEKRALTVAHYLIESGISTRRIVVVGYGQDDPIASNATAKGRAQNRRVLIELRPLVR